LPRPWCQHDLLFYIDHDQPLQKMTKALFLAILLLDAAEKISANSVWGLSRAIDGTGSAHLGFATAQAPHGFSQSALNRVIVQSLQKTIQRRVVGYRAQVQSLPQVTMLAETALGFAESPVFVTHQTENCQGSGSVSA
jgi:hypothetical protein